MTAYLAVTVHYIDSEWKLQAELLTFDELSGSHTGENTGQVLYNILNATGIKDKVSLNLVSFIFYANIYYTSQVLNATSDNVTINDKAMRVLAEKLGKDGVKFNAKDQRSQYVHCSSSTYFSYTLLTYKQVAMLMLSPSLRRSA